MSQVLTSSTKKFLGMTAFFFFDFLPYSDNEKPGDGVLVSSFAVNIESYVFVFLFDVLFLLLQPATSALIITMINNMIAISHNLIGLF